MPEDKIVQIGFHMAEIMRMLNLDLDDSHLRDTPGRFARMYVEVFSGLDEESRPDLTVFPNEDHDENRVMVADIPFYSMCAHHLIPFWGYAHVAYVPGDWIADLSKVAGVVAYYARRPQIQERLTHQVVEYIEEALEPKGAMVVIEARHMCMEMRGVEKPGTWTTTSAVRGVLADRVEREAFMAVLQRSDGEGEGEEL